MEKFIDIFYTVPNNSHITINIVAWDNLTKTTYIFGIDKGNESFLLQSNRGFIHYNLMNILLKHDIKNVFINSCEQYGLSLCEMIEGFKIAGINVNRYVSKLDYIKQN